MAALAAAYDVVVDARGAGGGGDEEEEGGFYTRAKNLVRETGAAAALETIRRAAATA